MTRLRPLVTLLVGFAVTASLPGQTLGLQVRLVGTASDGGNFQQAPVLGGDGWLYGVSFTGGAGNNGVVYRLPVAGGGRQILQEFQAATQGSGLTMLLEGSDGRLYGTATVAGPNAGGTLWRLDRNGDNFVVLRAFATADGQFPTALVEGPDGRLYGSNSSGGPNGGGTVWRCAKNGSGFQVVRAFTPATDGNSPYARLTFLADGRLYGTTLSGGSANGGTVFRAESDGANFTVLHHFNPPTDGGVSLTRLLLEPGGTLLGATLAGGANGAGTLYRIRPDGTGFQVLRAFGVPPALGTVASDLFLPGDGFLYGGTQGGGADAKGGLFRIRPDGTGYQELASFTTASGGVSYGAFTALGEGRYLGAAQSHGPNSLGSIYQFTLPPPSITVRGGTRVTTRAPRVTLRGTAENAVRVEAKVGRGSYRPISTTTTWTLRVPRLPRGRTLVLVRAVSGAGVISPETTITITRRKGGPTRP